MVVQQSAAACVWDMRTSVTPCASGQIFADATVGTSRESKAGCGRDGRPVTRPYATSAGYCLSEHTSWRRYRPGPTPPPAAMPAIRQCRGAEAIAEKTHFTPAPAYITPRKPCHQPVFAHLQRSRRRHPRSGRLRAQLCGESSCRTSAPAVHVSSRRIAAWRRHSRW